MSGEAEIEYWSDCISEAADECSLAISDDQLRCLAKAIAVGRDCFSMSFPSGPPDPYQGHMNEVAELERKLTKERSMVFCKACQGTGRLEYSSGPWAVNAHCDDCNGRGKRLP